MRKELLDLVRSLRLRVESSRHEDWGRPCATARKEPGAPPKKDPPSPPEREPVPPAPGAREAWAGLGARIAACRRCPLGATRIKPVPGSGSVSARIMFIGEGPGRREDLSGEPFVGKAGALLDDILRAMGLDRGKVFIANMVKCHPMKDPTTPEARGNDRPPSPEELASCRTFLDEQIRLVSPRVIVCLGAVSAQALLGTSEGISRLRGKWRDYAPPGGGDPIRVMPTYHPAALLRDATLKRPVWTDMRAVMAAEGLKGPSSP